MAKAGKKQIDIVNDLGFDKSAVSSWVNGTRLPRMDKVNALAVYLGCSRSDLIDEHTGTEPPQSSPSPEEEQLLEHFNQLNRTGREKVLEDVESMTYNPRYKRGESSKEA
jgi:transcriptional regulator with XRE-family HTH domain